MAPKKYSAPCHWGCGTILESNRKIPAMLGCGVGTCHDKHNEAVRAIDEAARIARNARRRAERANPRPAPQAVMGDWAMACMLGGAGRRNRP